MKRLILLFLFTIPIIFFGQNENEKLRAKNLFFEAVDSYNTEKYQDAIIKAKLSNSFNPSEGAYQIIGLSMFILGDYKGSIKNHSYAIKLNPSPENYSDRADAKVSIRDLEGALLDYSAAIKKTSMNNLKIADYFSSRGFVYKNMKKYYQAINDYTSAININPNDPYYFFERSDCYYEVEDYKNARLDLFEPIVIKENKIKFYTGLALINLKEGDREDACLYFQSAIEEGYDASSNLKKVFEDICN